MAMGIVFNRFERLIHGLCMTITAIEHNPRKEEILRSFAQHNITDIPVRLSRNYGHPFFQRDHAYFMAREESAPREEEALFPDIFAPE